MTSEDEMFLTELYQHLNKQAVPPDSPQYVPLEELPGQVLGPDAVQLLRLKRDLRRWCRELDAINVFKPWVVDGVEFTAPEERGAQL